ncbi:MAG: hypothetical protein N2312_02550 [Dictyoglomaceae bacterium]|nr:hypothetical protein [Dictyoglomaceae bacterium]
MKKWILLIFIAFFLISEAFGSEWGILELNTEVFSSKEKAYQKYNFLLEKWWSENLGITANLGYEEYFKYRLGLQTPYLRGIYGYFYPNLNSYTKYLRFKGLFLGLYILKDEIYLLTGENIDDNKPLRALGWQRLFTPNNIANFSLLSYKESYNLNINLLQKHTLPLGICYTSEEFSFLIKDSRVYISGLAQGEISIGNFSLKGYFGSNHSLNFNLYDIKPGELGGELSLRTPLIVNIFSGISGGYFHNFSNGIGRLKLGASMEWNLRDYLNLESLTTFEYIFKEEGEYSLNQRIQLNFPTLEGALVGSIYWIYKLDKTITGEVKDENQTFGLKLSYQF